MSGVIIGFETKPSQRESDGRGGKISWAVLLPQALVMARRELRGGIRGLRIVLACLALGVAAIAAVGTLRAAIDAAMRSDGARLLGGDVEIHITQVPLPEEARRWLLARGAVLSEIVQMRAMAIAPSGERTLVELKAVDAAYPLYGELRLEPAGGLGAGGVALDRAVVERLGLRLGDEVRLGEARLRFLGEVAGEPDKVASSAVLGPRALISAADLAATRLVLPGSLLAYDTRIRLPEGTDRAGFLRDLRAAFPDRGWRIRAAGDAAPGVNRFLDRAAFFLTLASLTALLVGGIGVATGVRAWLDQRARTIATLRCLGAPGGLIFATYLLQVLALALAGIAIGLVAGFSLSWLGASMLGEALPVPPRPGLYAAPLAMAALYGLLTALAFSLWPLGRALEIPGAALFRDAVQPNGARPRATLVGAVALAGGALAVLVVATAENRVFAAGFVAAAVATLALFRLGAWALMAAARRIQVRGWPAWRLGLANLHRPGSATPLMLVSLGIGLTTLSSIALIEGNLRRQIGEQLPQAAPSFYFIDIQSDQTAAFDALAVAQPGVSDLRRVPSLRARVTAVNGVPVNQVRVSEETAWALRGDRGLTYAATPPEGTRLAAGEWWPADYAGAPLISFDAALARGWGVAIGDTVTLNVLGRDIVFRIANLRDIAWRALSMNFVFVASPGMLQAAPHTHIATLRAPEAQESAVLRVLSDAFPNISGIRVRDALAAVAEILTRLGAAMSGVAGVTLAAGALVLAGAVAAGQRRRIRDAVILKTIGASRAQIRRAFLVEFGLLGLAAGVIAAAAGTAAAWAVVRFVMKAEWAFLPGTLALTVTLCTLLVLSFGYVGTALALRARPAPMLRNE